MTTFLVTGGAAQLGRPTVCSLRAAGHDVRVLRRRGAAGALGGDLVTGRGIAAAVTGVHTVVHLASTHSARDVDASRVLVSAASAAGVTHLVYISIVGVDDIPLPYYRAKAAAERVIAGSGLPHSILRATQFHPFVERLFSAQRALLPVTLVPASTLQPIAVEEVAARLVELATGSPAGRVADIGGPEQLTGRDLATRWTRASGSRRPLVALRLPGRTFAGFAAGHALVDGPPFGHGTFDRYIAEPYPR
jgi:uncharacterized protein YbjT (DUF2867 family)